MYIINQLKLKQMENLTALTTEQIKRINNSLLETQRMLNKELAYSKDLQNNKLISQLQTHILKLIGMLLNGWNAPKFN